MIFFKIKQYWNNRWDPFFSFIQLPNKVTTQLIKQTNDPFIFEKKINKINLLISSEWQKDLLFDIIIQDENNKRTKNFILKNNTILIKANSINTMSIYRVGNKVTNKEYYLIFKINDLIHHIFKFIDKNEN